MNVLDQVEWKTCPLCKNLLSQDWRNSYRATCRFVNYGEVGHYILVLETNNVVVEYLYINTYDLWFDQKELNVHKPSEPHSKDLRLKIDRETFLQLLEIPNETDLVEKVQKLINFQ